MRKKKEIFLWFLTRKWKVGLWCNKRSISTFAKTCTGIDRHSCPLRRALVASYLLFVSFACRADVFMHRLYFYASICYLTCVSLVWKRCWFEKNSSRKMKKFRQNFFESIQSDWAKKMKVLPNTLWGDFKKKNMFCKHVNKSAFLFFSEIQIYLRLIFCWETCLHRSFLTQN